MNDPGKQVPPAVSGSSRKEEEGSSTASRGDTDRLPPPAFPPGSRRTAAAPGRASAKAESRPVADEFLEGAIILPDAPFRSRGERAPDSEWTFDSAEDVEVTGIGTSDPDYLGATAGAPFEVRDPDQIARILETLSRNIREYGPMALLSEPGISRFESVLRGYIAGYLVRGEGRE